MEDGNTLWGWIVSIILPLNPPYMEDINTHLLFTVGDAYMETEATFPIYTGEPM